MENSHHGPLQVDLQSPKPYACHASKLGRRASRLGKGMAKLSWTTSSPRISQSEKQTAKDQKLGSGVHIKLALDIISIY